MSHVDLCLEHLRVSKMLNTILGCGVAKDTRLYNAQAHLSTATSYLTSSSCMEDKSLTGVQTALTIAKDHISDWFETAYKCKPDSIVDKLREYVKEHGHLSLSIDTRTMPYTYAVGAGYGASFLPDEVKHIPYIRMLKDVVEFEPIAVVAFAIEGVDLGCVRQIWSITRI